MELAGIHPVNPNYAPFRQKSLGDCTRPVRRRDRNSLLRCYLVWNTRRHETGTKTNFINGNKNLLYPPKSPPFYPHERTVTPRYLPLSITDSVTLHCITLTLLGQPSSCKNLLRRQETGDSLRASTHHWCATPKQQTPQITVTTKHIRSHLLSPSLRMEACTMSAWPQMFTPWF